MHDLARLERVRALMVADGHRQGVFGAGAVIADCNVIERHAGREGELLYDRVRGMEVHVAP